jgi:hypothetical protein
MTPRESTPPRVVVGLNAIDKNGDNKYVVRVHAYADSISYNEFRVHIDTWSDSTLYNGGLSWLKLSSADPEIHCGKWSCSKVTSETVSFDWFFDAPPTVFVGLSKIDIGDNWRAHVYATNITNTGFTINASNLGGSTDFYGCEVTWVAVSAGKEGALCGTFGGNTTTKTGSQ